MVLLAMTWATSSSFSGTALAAEPTWSVPAVCPDAAVVTSKVRELLRGHDYPSDELARFSGSITRAGGSEPRWVLRLSLGKGAGERERVMEASRCDDLGDAAALAMALAIHPELELPEADLANESSVESTAQSSPPPAAPLEDPPPAVESVQVPPQPPLPAPPNPPAQQPGLPVAPVVASTRGNAPGSSPFAEQGAVGPAGAAAQDELGVSALAALSVDVGALPETTPGFFGAVSVSSGGQRFELGGGFTPPTGTRRDTERARASFSVYRAKFSACHNPFQQETLLFACAFAEGGAIWARGHGVDAPDAQAVPWFAPGTGFLALGKLAPQLSLDVRGEVLFPLTNDRFEVDGDVVHEVPRVALRGSVGMEYRFR